MKKEIKSQKSPKIPNALERESNQEAPVAKKPRAKKNDSRPVEGTATSPAVHEEAKEARTSFAKLGVHRDVLHALSELGYGDPTPIQEQTITILLSGRDVIGQAPTGTGKTAAFGIPIVQSLVVRELRPQALIVVPTRELALQVAEAIHTIGKYREAVVLPVYGGQPIERQIRALAHGVQVVVGTPGRLLDHLSRKTLDLAHVRTVVLDEADEMLEMGFIEDIEAILEQLPEQRQMALFSATIPPRITGLGKRYLHDPAQVLLERTHAVKTQVRHVYYEVPYYAKAESLCRILDLQDPPSAIVFVRTKIEADALSERLNGLGYLAQAIHGDLNQAQRERALRRFRDGQTTLLVATDVAARGLDIPYVTHVINYDLPDDPDSYLHRIGRTGRAGRSGEALTLLTPRERRSLVFIERTLGQRMERLQVPSDTDIASRRRETFKEGVLQILDEGELDEYIELVEELADSHDPAEIAAAAFKMIVEARRRGDSDGSAVLPAPASTPPPLARPSRDSRSSSRSVSQDLGDSSGAPVREDTRSLTGERDLPSRENRPRPVGEIGVPEPGMMRLFLNLGHKDRLRPTDIVGAIANEADLPGTAIGSIDIYETFSFVEVPSEFASHVITMLNRTTIRGRKVDLKPARRPATG